MTRIRTTLVGNIATEPTSKLLESGLPCTSFRMAVNHPRLNRDTGAFEDDKTSWFSVDCYGALASNIVMSLRTGTPVILEGRLEIQNWDNGTKTGTTARVIADHLGPDLRLGTANFRKAAGGQRPPRNETSVGAGDQQPDRWGLPPNTEGAEHIVEPNFGGVGTGPVDDVDDDLEPAATDFTVPDPRIFVPEGLEATEESDGGVEEPEAEHAGLSGSPF